MQRWLARLLITKVLFVTLQNNRSNLRRTINVNMGLFQQSTQELRPYMPPSCTIMCGLDPVISIPFHNDI